MYVFVCTLEKKSASAFIPFFLLTKQELLNTNTFRVFQLDYEIGAKCDLYFALIAYLQWLHSFALKKMMQVFCLVYYPLRMSIKEQALSAPIPLPSTRRKQYKLKGFSSIYLCWFFFFSFCSLPYCKALHGQYSLVFQI